MIIKFKNYKDGVHDLLFIEPAKSLGLGIPFVEDVTVKCRMDKSHHQIVLNCSLQVPADLQCDRCNSEFRIDIKNNFNEIYFFNQDIISENNENVRFISPDSDHIDFGPDVKEYALLSIPMKILCSNECKGICPRCGKNLNMETCNCENEKVDPVWDQLLDLKNKLKK